MIHPQSTLQGSLSQFAKARHGDRKDGLRRSVSGLIHRIIGDELGAIDVARRVRNREDDEIGDFLGRAPARVAGALIGRPLRALARRLLRAEPSFSNLAFPFGKTLQRTKSDPWSTRGSRSRRSQTALARPQHPPRCLILHAHQIKPVRRGDLAAGRAVASGQRAGEITGAPFAFADMHQRADHGAHLMMQE